MSAEDQLRQGLLAANHTEDELQQQQQREASAAEADSPASSSRPGSDDVPGCDDAAEPGESPLLTPERSLLSRAGSLTTLARNTPAPPRPGGHPLAFVAKTSCWFTTTLLVLLASAVGIVYIAFPLPPEGGLPACRNGAALAVLPSGSNATQQHMVVWSGRGQAGGLYHDVFTLTMGNLTWKKEKERALPPPVAKAGQQQEHRLLPTAEQEAQQQQQQQAQRTPRRLSVMRRKPPVPPPPSLPAARWKAGAVHVPGLGMLVHGGATFELKGEEQALNLNDFWLMRSSDLRWQQGCASNSSGSCSGEAPAPGARRGHTMVSYKDAEGRPAVLLFGGERQDGLALNDVWAGAVDWPRINWTLLSDPSSGTGQGPAPLPRKGHVAVMPDASTMLIQGGRSDVYGSFSDVWAFSLATNRWQPLLPATAAQPAARHHHGAAFWKGRLLIFGGRFGTATEATRPIGDRWLFEVSSRTWWQLPIRGFSPLPRFLFASAQLSPPGGGADQFVVFGGQTGSDCKLNDAWRLDLETHRWVQLSAPSFATPECNRQFG